MECFICKGNHYYYLSDDDIILDCPICTLEGKTREPHSYPDDKKVLWEDNYYEDEKRT